ncbi:hypothetical protein OC846_005659 [Tilletia horrida]|uniref:CN hydrolase domain-containing protein n=1 Tax=Tilletia horrida TaxID=155126 RepID=A0AAN6GKD8_9BASI|nr:hypothetical protein OC845_005828 [Tilletia horrida]KAK0545449.1 hypothetical protein OC846_005659 [Tilletia horrida]KAK0561451.1 hypothetical protein OC861_005803 [Tilletia horrida]
MSAAAAAALNQSQDIRVVGSLSSQPSPSSLRLALAQVLPSDAETHPSSASTVEDDDAASIGKLRTYAAAAARSGADVVCFPEYFLTGATHTSWKAVREKQEPVGAHENPVDDDSHWLFQVANIAQEYDIDIVAGTVVELGAHHIPHRHQPGSKATSNHANNSSSKTEAERVGGQLQLQTKDLSDHLFNTAYYISRTGTVAAKYTKRNLWHPERSVLSPGHPSSHPSPRLFEIETKRGLKLKASMLICWDLAMPEAFRALLQPPADGSNGPLEGPDVVFVPTCWYATDAGVKGLRWNKFGEAAVLDSFSMARAIETESIIAMCNIAGPHWPNQDPSSVQLDGENITDADIPVVGVGHSSVHAPFLGCLGKVEDGDEALLLAEIDTKVLVDARDVYRVRHDLADVVE